MRISTHERWRIDRIKAVSGRLFLGTSSDANINEVIQKKFTFVDFKFEYINALFDVMDCSV